MMISLEEYRKELKNLTLEELSERKQKLEKFINDYENNNLFEQEYSVELSPQTKYKLFKEYLDEVMIELGLRRHQSEWEGVKVFESQCANCKNYLGDINCKIYGEITFDILGNKKVCPNRKDNVERNDKNIKENQITEGENNFKFLNKNIEKLTKELAQAYENNDQEQITKLQNKIKDATNRQLKKDVNKLVKEDLKEKNYYINRETLLNKLGYLYDHRDKRKNYLTEKDFILNELKTIKNELMSNDGFETPYIPCVRAQHCINEFIYYLEKKQVNDCLMDIYEVIESDKNGIYNPAINKDFNYSIYIGNEEKSIILNMVNRLEAYLNNSSNKYSTENLFKKAKEEFNYFVENEYGVNKYLSLPLPLSYNKLKSLILLSSASETEEIYKCGYVLIDTVTGNIEYKLETEQLLSNNFQLNLLNFTPKIEIPINNKDDYNNLYDRYFKLLDDLILMYESKSEYVENKDKIKEFLNIYRNIAFESEQIEYSLNNEFLSWCLISLPK